MAIANQGQVSCGRNAKERMSDKRLFLLRRPQYQLGYCTFDRQFWNLTRSNPHLSKFDSSFADALLLMHFEINPLLTFLTDFSPTLVSRSSIVVASYLKLYSPFVPQSLQGHYRNVFGVRVEQAGFLEFVSQPCS